MAKKLSSAERIVTTEEFIKYFEGKCRKWRMNLRCGYRSSGGNEGKRFCDRGRKGGCAIPDEGAAVKKLWHVFRKMIEENKKEYRRK